MSAFESNSQATPEQNPASNNAFVDQLTSIKNESGEQKYDSVEKALEALQHSQNYIPELKTSLSEKEQEIAALKEELNKRAAVEEVVEKLTANQPDQSTPQVSGLGEQEVLNLVQNFSQQQETQKSKAQNEQMVSDSLFASFGDSTPKVVADKAAELGMTVEGLQALSQSSPQAALKLFEVKSSGSVKVSTSSVNQGLNQNQEDTGLPMPEKSLMLGASHKEQVDHLQKIKARVYKKFDVQV